MTPPPELTDTLSVGQILENKYRVERIVDEDRIAITALRRTLPNETPPVVLSATPRRGTVRA